jgi:preprotein translocase subunit SecE
LAPGKGAVVTPDQRARGIKKDGAVGTPVPGSVEGFMATQAVKVKNEESGGNAITGAAAGIGQRVSGTIADTREFMHDVRVEMKQVTWPSKDDVVATTTVVIATVFFFGLFLAVVDWLVQRGVAYVFKIFGV